MKPKLFKVYQGSTVMYQHCLGCRLLPILKNKRSINFSDIQSLTFLLSCRTITILNVFPFNFVIRFPAEMLSYFYGGTQKCWCGIINLLPSTLVK